MPWIKVPAEHHPLFFAALPADPRIETMKMFGGIVAKVNGHIFAGLFGESTMVWLDEAGKKDAIAAGAKPFDPMGDGRARSDKLMLPKRLMKSPAELRDWIARAFEAASKLAPKEPKKKKARAPGAARSRAKASVQPIVARATASAASKMTSAAKKPAARSKKTSVTTAKKR
jgi:TfoX/Sxy family transcriptional regulator of competence genes